MTPIENFVALAQAADMPSRTLFATELAALVSAVAAVFAALSALANLGTVREMRTARRPLIDVSTHAGEAQFTWSSRPSDIQPRREVRYFRREGEPASDPSSDWALIVLLENLSEHGATNIMSTLQLRPALTRRDVAILGLSEGIGGNTRYRLSWNDGRYWLYAPDLGGCGWFDAFTQPLGRISNIPALGARAAVLSHTTFENLLVVLYREALLAARTKTRDVMCRPRMIYHLSYRGPTGERIYRKYVIDLTIQHLTFKVDEHATAAEYGAPSSWREFDARVSLAMRDATDSLPWRFRISSARRVWRHMIDASQGHFGFRRESLRRRLRRAYYRWPALLRWWWQERAKWWHWRETLRDASTGS